ncbi:MAG: hypothetical protein WAN51_11165 [Alphaproteobacteria bacterium]
MSQSNKAALAKGVLMMFLQKKLAQDAKIDLRPVLAGITNANFKGKKADIIADIRNITRGKLARDADLGELPPLMDALERVEEPDDEVGKANSLGLGDFLSAIGKWARENLSPEEVANLDNFLWTLCPADAQDQPPDFAGMPKTGGGMVAEPAMDASPGGYDRRFPDAARIGNLGGGETPWKSKPASGLSRQSQQPPARIDSYSDEAMREYNARFPDAAHIKNV